MIAKYAFFDFGAAFVLGMLTILGISGSWKAKAVSPRLSSRHDRRFAGSLIPPLVSLRRNHNRTRCSELSLQRSARSSPVVGPNNRTFHVAANLSGTVTSHGPQCTHGRLVGDRRSEARFLPTPVRPALSRFSIAACIARCTFSAPGWLAGRNRKIREKTAAQRGGDSASGPGSHPGEWARLEPRFQIRGSNPRFESPMVK